MKKDYVKPEMLVEEVILESVLLTQSVPGEVGGVIPLSNERDQNRGSWGNLWD